MPSGVHFGAMIISPARGRTEAIFVRQHYCSCFITMVALWLLAVIMISMSYYQTSTVVLGPNSSELFKFNPWLVGEFKACDNGRVGPMLYGFDTRPDLNLETSWTERHNLMLDPSYHQEFTMWLNKGSNITLNCSIYSPGSPGIMVAILQGYGKLQEWIEDPENFRVTLAWKVVHGKGSLLEVQVPTDGKHYIAVGNPNLESVEILLQFEIRAMVYNTSTSHSRCSLQSKSCKLKISSWGQRYALVTTPPSSQNGSIAWEIHLSYGVRWFSFGVGLAGIVSVIAAALAFVTSLNPGEPTTATEALLRPKRSPDESSTSSYGAIGQDPMNPLRDPAGGEMQEPEICTICFDASRNSFFIPCGHFATCVTCAWKIHSEVNSRCPICRQRIQEVKTTIHAPPLEM